MGGDIEINHASRFVKAKTMGGDIAITVDDGWIRATTMAGDIDVAATKGLGEGNKGIELNSLSGDITVEIPSDLPIKLDLLGLLHPDIEFLFCDLTSRCLSLIEGPLLVCLDQPLSGMGNVAIHVLALAPQFLLTS